MKDANMTTSLLIIEIIITHSNNFEEIAIKKDFVPLLLKEIERSDCFVDNWLLDNFPKLIDFLNTFKIETTSLKGFIKV